MGFDYSYSLLPMSNLANFREACIRCFGEKSFSTKLYELKKNKASKEQANAVIHQAFNRQDTDVTLIIIQGCSEDDIYDYLKTHQVFYWLAPRPWKENLPCSEDFGGVAGSYEIITKETIVAKLKEKEPQWIQGSMEQEFSEKELAQNNNLYKKMIQVSNQFPEGCFLVLGTSW